MKIRRILIVATVLPLLACAGKGTNTAPSSAPAPVTPTRTCEEALTPLVTRMMLYPEDAQPFDRPSECKNVSDGDYQRLIIKMSLELSTPER